MKILLIAITLTILSGCGTNVSKSKLYWGSYSNTLYKTRTDPGAETTQLHLKELESIVNKSKEMGLRVPPGIYAEIGFIHMSKNEAKKASVFFELESKEYPESKKFISTLMTKYSR
ncbi:MAG: DUF4810 domain-containing protein [Chromatiales bacterium]|nr:DUF4810 domain-containing protein [Chromatiales bacterium]